MQNVNSLCQYECWCRLTFCWLYLALGIFRFKQKQSWKRWILVQIFGVNGNFPWERTFKAEFDWNHPYNGWQQVFVYRHFEFRRIEWKIFPLSNSPSRSASSQLGVIKVQLRLEWFYVGNMQAALKGKRGNLSPVTKL